MWQWRIPHSPLRAPQGTFSSVYNFAHGPAPLGTLITWNGLGKGHS